MGFYTYSCLSRKGGLLVVRRVSLPSHGRSAAARSGPGVGSKHPRRQWSGSYTPGLHHPVNEARSCGLPIGQLGARTGCRPPQGQRPRLDRKHIVRNTIDEPPDDSILPGPLLTELPRRWSGQSLRGRGLGRRHALVTQVSQPRRTLATRLSHRPGQELVCGDESICLGSKVQDQADPSRLTGIRSLGRSVGRTPRIRQ